jgi:hypothetical protein
MQDVFEPILKEKAEYDRFMHYAETAKSEDRRVELCLKYLKAKGKLPSQKIEPRLPPPYPTKTYPRTVDEVVSIGASESIPRYQFDAYHDKDHSRRLMFESIGRKLLHEIWKNNLVHMSEDHLYSISDKTLVLSGTMKILKPNYDKKENPYEQKIPY